MRKTRLAWFPLVALAACSRSLAPGLWDGLPVGGYVDMLATGYPAVGLSDRPPPMPGMPLDARLGPRFREGTALRADGGAVRFVPVGARDAALLERGAHGLYRDVWPATDVVQQVEAARVKEALVLKSATAPRRFAFDAETTLTARAQDDGHWLLVDAAGQTVFFVERPFVVDATGRRVDLAWQVTGTRWTVDLPAGLAYPLVLDPSAGVPSWTNRTTATTPGARYGAAMAWDGTRMVLFGGSSDAAGATLIDTTRTMTWTLAGGWVDVAVAAGAPTPRRGHSMASVVGGVVVFGGFTGSDEVGDFYYWSAASQTWAQKTLSAPIPKRQGAAIATTNTAPTSKTVVIQGGIDVGAPSVVYNTAYDITFNPTLTTAAVLDSTGSFPTAEGYYGHVMLLSGSQLVVFGGQNAAGTVLDGTSIATRSGSAWVFGSPTFPTPHPVARREASFVPFPTYGAEGLLFGGANTIGDPLNDTWLWNGTAWSQVLANGGAGNPTARRYHAAAFDETRNRLIVVGGKGVAATPLNDTWELRINNRPDLGDPGAKSVAEGSALTFTVTADDPVDSTDNLTLTLASLRDGSNQVPPSNPSLSTIFPSPTAANPATGTFTFTPGFLDAGVYTATFNASDGVDSATPRTVVITVTNTNRNPTITLDPNDDTIDAIEGIPVAFTATAADADTDDTLTFSNGTLPSGAAVGNAGLVKTFTWVPSFTQGSVAGTDYVVSFTADDGDGSPVVRNVTITVHNQPVIDTTPAGPSFTVAELSPLTFTVQNDVADGIPLTITTVGGLPSGATFNGTTFSWTPSCSQSRTAPYVLVFQASDTQRTAQITRNVTVTGSVVTVFPTTHTFSPTAVGQTSGGQTFTVTNGGATAFNLNAITVSNPAFVLSGVPPLPFTLAGGASREVTVAFAPVAAIAYSELLTFTTNDGVCPTNTATLNGQGLSVSVNPGSHDFGDVRVGQLGTPRTITLTNNGTSSIQVNLPVLTGGPDFTLTYVSPVAGAYPFTLGAGASVTVSANFAPQSIGAKTGAVTFTTNIPGAAPIAVGLSGRGTAPGIAVSPMAIDFGAVDIDAGVATRTVTVTNDGTFALQLDTIALSGPGVARYSIATAPALPAIVAPGGTAEIVVGYDPTLESDGEPAAALTVTSNAFGEPTIVLPITGRGADRHIALSQLALAFPPTRRNSESTLDVIVQNTGEAPLALAELTFVGDGAAAFSTAQGPATVPPGGELSITVRFRPTAAAMFSGELVLTNDDDGLPMAAIALSGLGVLPPLSIAPGELSANVVPVGIKRRLADRFVISNPQDVAAEITQVCVGAAGSETCDPSSPFSVVAFEAAQTLEAQSDLELAVEFAPTAAGLFNGRVLVFVDGDPAPLLFVAVAGEGIDDVVLSGGGCAVGERGGAGAAWLFLVALACLTRRRGLPVLAVLLAASAAEADPATSFDLGVFRPTVPTRASFITVEPPEIHSPHVFGAGLTFDYARNPLLATRAGMEQMTDAPVSDRSELILGLTYALPRVQLTLEVPLLHQSGHTSFTGLEAADGTSLGDVTLHARVAIWKNDVVALAASAQLGLPTGDAGAYAGSDGLVVKGLAIVGVRVGRLRLAVNSGARARTSSAVLGNIEQGSEWVYGAGGAVRLLRGLDGIAEVFGSRQIGGGGQVSPLEALVGGRLWATEQLAISAGGGLGVVSGVGAPDARVFVGVAWFPTETTLKGGQRGVAFGGIVDTDEDGLPDTADECPAEPEDVDGVHDDDGCVDADNDNDGIADVSDKCPDAAEDGDEFQDEDGCPEMDNDGDKVVDARDQCPAALEDADGFRDEDGCPDPDNDGDGLPDAIDQCPLEAEVVNGNADDDGCPDPGDALVMMLPDKLELLAPVEFVGESANVKPSSRAVLAQVATTLRLAPHVSKVRIAAHVHRRGGGPADYALSLKRGEAVKKLLIERGVDGARLEVKPYGSTKPLGARDLNDRIVFEIVK
jgi:outer membrane protein OmpA-like peptidoglycan-associated protein